MKRKIVVMLCVILLLVACGATVRGDMSTDGIDERVYNGVFFCAAVLTTNGCIVRNYDEDLGIACYHRVNAEYIDCVVVEQGD